MLTLVLVVGLMPAQAQAAKKPAVKKVTLKYKEYVLKKGEKLRLKATVTPKSGFEFFFALATRIIFFTLERSAAKIVILAFPGFNAFTLPLLLTETTEDQDIVWSSTDDSIAAVVSAQGEIMALTPGTATITAVSQQDGRVSASMKVTVSEVHQHFCSRGN